MTPFAMVLLLSGLGTVVLSVIGLQSMPPMNFDAFRSTSLNHKAHRAWRWRPENILLPPGMERPRPHSLAARADRDFRKGAWAEARNGYDAAVRAAPSDVYSRFLRACLDADAGERVLAREGADAVATACPWSRTARLLQLFLEESRPGNEPTESYFRALARAVRDESFQQAPTVDFLAQALDQRLFMQPIRLQRSKNDRDHSILTIASGHPSPLEARALMDRAETIPEALLALSALDRDPSVSVRLEVTDQLRALCSLEPDNSYLALLHAVRSVPGLHRLDGLDERTPSSALERPLLEALRRKNFRTYAAEIRQLIVDAERRRGHPFPGWSVPPTHSFLFLGDRSFVPRVVVAAATAMSDREQPWEALTLTSLRLFEREDQLFVDPFESRAERRRLRTSMLLDSARVYGLADRSLEQTFQRVVPPRDLPHQARQLRPHLRRTLPLPSLLGPFAERIHADPEALVAELHRRVY